MDMNPVANVSPPSHPSLSVAICTHNPRRDFLERTLAGLRAQTLATAEWEFLLVDNGSKKESLREGDWQWHPTGQLLVEPKLGLTHARIAAMTAARADLLVFVDDDNILAADYLANCLEVGRNWPQLGIWGGSITPEFEVPPAEWTKPYWYCLACREVLAPRWTNQTTTPDMVPFGAGFCLRRVVWETYLRNVVDDPHRLALGRTGGSLASAEDVDLWYECLGLGLGAGLFPQMRLIHLIPPNRLDPAYLLRLVESNHYCLTLLRCLRRVEKVPPVPNFWQRLKSLPRRVSREIALLQQPAFERLFQRAWGRGVQRAYATARELGLKKA
jgi:glycosyltransferase involved in cell wall biosynthesis